MWHALACQLDDKCSILFVAAKDLRHEARHMTGSQLVIDGGLSIGTAV